MEEPSFVENVQASFGRRAPTRGITSHSEVRVIRGAPLAPFAGNFKCCLTNRRCTSCLGAAAPRLSPPPPSLRARARARGRARDAVLASRGSLSLRPRARAASRQVDRLRRRALDLSHSRVLHQRLVHRHLRRGDLPPQQLHRIPFAAGVRARARAPRRRDARDGDRRERPRSHRARARAV